MTTKFPLGRTVATAGVEAKLSPFGISVLINRHSQGDWGTLPKEDAELNESALQFGGRLFSAYETAWGKVWVITEADRSATTVLFPDEY